MSFVISQTTPISVAWRQLIFSPPHLEEGSYELLQLHHKSTPRICKSKDFRRRRFMEIFREEDRIVHFHAGSSAPSERYVRYFAKIVLLSFNPVKDCIWVEKILPVSFRPVRDGITRFVTVLPKFRAYGTLQKTPPLYKGGGWEGVCIPQKKSPPR